MKAEVDPASAKALLKKALACAIVLAFLIASAVPTDPEERMDGAGIVRKWESSGTWVSVPWSDVKVSALRDVWRDLAADRAQLEAMHLVPLGRRNRVPTPRRGRPGRKPGFGAYPTREALLEALLPAYAEAQEEMDGEPPAMKHVVPKLNISRARLRALRSQWGIPWPPVS